MLMSMCVCVLNKYREKIKTTRWEIKSVSSYKAALYRWEDQLQPQWAADKHWKLCPTVVDIEKVFRLIFIHIMLEPNAHIHLCWAQKAPESLIYFWGILN